ncbi:MAG: alpha/beta hydrolase [Anaerolineae bacterium]|nr:alpha/beta hydrolase [Anaerolineae bacterium]
MTTTISDLGKVKICSEISGSEEATTTILLLHGWGVGLKGMQGVAQGLVSRGYRVHNLDLPGFGESDPPPQGEAWSVGDYADCVATYLHQQRLSRVSVIGHSFGGRIAIVLGAKYAHYIERLVLTDSAGVLPPKSMRDQLVGISKQLFKLPGLNALEKQAKEWAKQQLGSEDYKNAGILEPTFRKVIAEDLLPLAPAINAPTLLIWGDADQDTPLWQAKELEKAIPDAGLVVFNGAGHYAYLERLPDFLRIVDTFFKGS